jgi:hypothetical protein
MRERRALVGLLLSLWAVGCGEDAKPAPTAPLPPADGALVGADALTQALAAAPADRGNAAVKILERARIGAVPADAIGGRMLDQAVVGLEGSYSFDIDGDGANDELYVFTPNLEPVDFLAWSQGDQCFLAWREGDAAWLLLSACGGSEAGTIACQGEQCQRCPATGCQPCEVANGEVRCASPEAPDDDMGEPEADIDEDIFVPDRPGECNLECVSQRGAFCCKECGCEGEIRCVPECRTGTSWDCEQGCCFNYTTFACE